MDSPLSLPFRTWPEILIRVDRVARVVLYVATLVILAWATP